MWLDFETGEVSFEDQGRGITQLSEAGMAIIYGSKESREILGAELCVHEGGGLAQCSRSFSDTPHAIVEEGLRKALKDLNSKMALESSPVLPGCSRRLIC